MTAYYATADSGDGWFDRHARLRDQQRLHSLPGYERAPPRAEPFTTARHGVGDSVTRFDAAHQERHGPVTGHVAPVNLEAGRQEADRKGGREGQEGGKACSGGLTWRPSAGYNVSTDETHERNPSEAGARVRRRRPRRLAAGRLHPLPNARRRRLRQLLRRQRDGELYAGLFEPVRDLRRHPGRRVRRDLVCVGDAPGHCGLRGASGCTRERSRVPLRGLDDRARGRVVPRLCVVRSSGTRVCVVRDHVCGRDRALSGRLVRGPRFL